MRRRWRPAEPKRQLVGEVVATVIDDTAFHCLLAYVSDDPNLGGSDQSRTLADATRHPNRETDLSHGALSLRKGRWYWPIVDFRLSDQPLVFIAKQYRVRLETLGLR